MHTFIQCSSSEKKTSFTKDENKEFGRSILKFILLNKIKFILLKI